VAQLQAAEELEWVSAPDGPVLHFRRPNGWESVTNFSADEVDIPPGTVLSSAPLYGDQLPPDTTAWII
jgi:alpha-glucosidase